jgi:4-amino-4-deoxy-L-arabinose transferase-like glycosyltransferase
MMIGTNSRPICSTDMREEGRIRWWSRHRFVIDLTVVLLFSAAVRLYQIDGLSSGYDEGTYLMTAWLLARGFPLYTEVFTVQLPLLFQPTAWLFALWGPSSTVARCLEVGYALLGIAAVAYAGKLLWRPATGLVAALFLSLEMRYFIHSRVFMGTVASIAVGALAVACALRFQATGRRRWLLLAGALLSFSLLVKPLSIFIGLLLLWVIIARRRSEMPAAVTGHRFLLSFPWRAALLDCFYLGAAGLVLPVICSLLYDWQAMLRLLTSVQSARLGLGLGRLAKAHLTGYAYNNLPVLLLAALGIIQTIWRRNGLGVTAIVWLALDLVFFAMVRWQIHHLALLDVPLALLAAQPVGELINLARTRRLQPRPWSSLAAAVAALPLVYYLPKFRPK